MQLEDSFLATHESMLDTLVLRNLVEPSLHDSLQIQMSLEPHKKAMGTILKGNSTVKVRHFETNCNDPGDTITLDYQAIVDVDSADSADHLLMWNGNPSMLVRSVKLFISETDRAFRQNPTAHVFAMQLDTLLFLDHYTRVIRQIAPPLTARLDTAAATEGTGRPQGSLLIREEILPGMPGIRVEHYRGYLLGNLLPQFIFAFILLGLSASALAFAYRSLNKQVALNRLRDSFIANISHELKTPVSTLKLAMETLSSEGLLTDRRKSLEYLEMASRETERLEKMISRVLVHDAMQDGKVLPGREPCNLAEICRSAIGSLEIRILESGARVETILPEEPVTIYADREILLGVVVNLLDNSLKYGGTGPEVHLQVSGGNTGPSITVSDRGPGIPAEYQGMVFEKFFRVPSGDTHDVKGHGLGLSYVKQVMKSLGGKVTYRNRSGGGAEFTLHFPPQGS